MTEQDKQDLLKVFTEMRKEIVSGEYRCLEVECGICTNLSEFAYVLFGETRSKELSRVFDSLSPQLAEWEHYSGRECYPVPDPDSVQKNESEIYDDAGCIYDTSRNKFDQNTEYGKLRLSLLDFYIGKVSE